MNWNNIFISGKIYNMAATATATATATEKQYIEIAAVTAIKIANPT